MTAEVYAEFYTILPCQHFNTGFKNCYITFQFHDFQGIQLFSRTSYALKKTKNTENFQEFFRTDSMQCTSCQDYL